MLNFIPKLPKWLFQPLKFTFRLNFVPELSKCPYQCSNFTFGLNFSTNYQSDHFSPQTLLLGSSLLLILRGMPLSFHASSAPAPLLILRGTTLKQILEVLQLKGLLHHNTPPPAPACSPPPHCCHAIVPLCTVVGHAAFGIVDGRVWHRPCAPPAVTRPSCAVSPVRIPTSLAQHDLQSSQQRPFTSACDGAGADEAW